MVEIGKSGHRERMRKRFLSGDDSSRADETVLELLLSYSIPQKDVQPLAHDLMIAFGSLQNVLSADVESLCKLDGIKENSAVLLKLVDFIRQQPSSQKIELKLGSQIAQQVPLFSPQQVEQQVLTEEKPKAKTLEVLPEKRVPRMFSPSALKEAVAILPTLPESGSADKARAFLRSRLHFNSEGTRSDYAGYIVKRIFPEGSIDSAMLTFARIYEGRRELRDVCFYRFCKSEPLMADVVVDLLLPSIGVGKISREAIRTFLGERFGPSHKYITKCTQAIVETLTAANLANSEKHSISFAYRDILLPSFAFVIHSEFPEPGMYDISKLEQNRVIRAMLWNPDRVLPSLYELRNQGIISKISEIDNIRQFTTRWALDEVVRQIVQTGGRA